MTSIPTPAPPPETGVAEIRLEREGVSVVVRVGDVIYTVHGVMIVTDVDPGDADAPLAAVDPLQGNWLDEEDIDIAATAAALAAQPSRSAMREQVLSAVGDAIVQEMGLWPELRSALRTLSEECRQEFRGEVSRKAAAALDALADKDGATNG